MKCVISVLGKDTTGIVAKVATTLLECGANIDDISQTLLGEIFSMTMMVTLNPEVADFNTTQAHRRRGDWRSDNHPARGRLPGDVFDLGFQMDHRGLVLVIQAMYSI